MPIGNVTRGTTGYNRLRRVDRWIASLPVLRRTSDPLVADVGYGASPTTTLELRDRLARRAHRPRVVELLPRTGSIYVHLAHPTGRPASTVSGT